MVQDGSSHQVITKVLRGRLGRAGVLLRAGSFVGKDFAVATRGEVLRGRQAGDAGVICQSAALAMRRAGYFETVGEEADLLDRVCCHQAYTTPSWESAWDQDP